MSFFALGPWAIIHGIGPKLANSVISRIRTMMVPFERSLSKLSENHKIGEIGSTEFKLWRLKESLSHYYLCQLLLFKLYTSNEYVLCYCTGCWSFLRLMDLTPQDASTTMLGPLPSRSVRPLYYVNTYRTPLRLKLVLAMVQSVHLLYQQKLWGAAVSQLRYTVLVIYSYSIT